MADCSPLIASSAASTGAASMAVNVERAKARIAPPSRQLRCSHMQTSPHRSIDRWARCALPTLHSLTSRLPQNRLNGTGFSDQSRSLGESAGNPRCRGGAGCIRGWKSAIGRFPARGPSQTGFVCAFAVAWEHREARAIFAIESCRDLPKLRELVCRAVKGGLR